MFGELTIVGAVVSLLVQWLKKKYGTEGLKTTGIVLALSLLAGTAYYFLEGTEMWGAFLHILATASTAYALVFNQLKTKE